MPCPHRKRDNTLCFECYRRERQRHRAMLPLEAEAAPPLQVSRPSTAVAGSMDDRQLAHRRTMLAHQEGSAAVRSGRRAIEPT